MLQTGKIAIDINAGDPSLATVNFTGGTLQAGGTGFQNELRMTIGAAASDVATVDANGQTMSFNADNLGSLIGPGQLRVIDSAGGGTVVLGGTDTTGIPIPNSYAGGTTVLSGTLEVFYAQAIPNIGVLTVAGPGAIVSSVRAGTLFGSHAMGQAAVVGSPGVEITPRR